MTTQADGTYIPKVHSENGGDSLAVESAGDITVLSGGTLDIQAGATFKQGGQTLGLLVAAVAAGYKIARGIATTATASDTIATGLGTVVAALASFEDPPTLALAEVQAVVGNQSGAPAAGSILLKSWKSTSAADCTPIAATAFGAKVSWFAIGT